MINKKFIKIILALSIIFSPVSLFADDSVSVEITPRNPTPFSPVKATLVSYLFNVNTSYITWTVNGKVLLKGLGEKKLTLQTGRAGERIPVHVNVVTASNQVYESDLVISPESVEIIYETPESYTPLFYEGKSLPGEGAYVKFVAMPNISENNMKISPSSLSYSWYVNDEYQDDLSGNNRQSAVIPLDILSNVTTIKVVVFGPFGTKAEKSIEVYPHKVLPLIYEYDELFGVLRNKLLGKRIEKTKEFTLHLEPLYLSSKGILEDTAFYRWSLDGLPTTPLGGRTLLLKPKENSYGTRSLSIEVGNTKRKLQKDNISTVLVFDTR